MLNSKEINTGYSKKSFFIILFCVLCYELSIDVIYLIDMSQRYAYAGSLMLSNVSYSKMFISILSTIVTLYLHPICSLKRKCSAFLFFLFYLITYVPFSCYYWLNNQSSTYYLYEVFCILLIEICLKGKAKRISISYSKPSLLFKCAVLIYLLFSVALFLRNGGINWLTLSMNTVMEARTQYSITGIWGYALNWCVKSLMPIIFAYYIYKKQLSMAFIACVLQLLLYLSYGFRSFFVSVALLICISFLVEKKEHSFPKIISFGLSILNISSLLLEELKITDFLYALLPYRTLMVPAQGQFSYYKFFQKNDFLYFSEGIIGRLLGISYPYSSPIGVIVNNYIYGGFRESNGNTGIFSYGYADLGFTGMILAAIVLIIILNLVDCITYNLPKSIVIGSLAYQIALLNDTNVMITLNTGGLLLSILLLSILNKIWGNETIFPIIIKEDRDKENEENKKNRD